jgi:hypothetical protein
MRIENFLKLSIADRENVTELDCYDCTGLTALPELPASLTKLYCYDCTGLTALPELPASLTKLYCDGCTGLTALPELPASLTKLYCDGCTGIAELSELPAGWDDRMDTRGLRGEMGATLDEIEIAVNEILAKKLE